MHRKHITLYLLIFSLLLVVNFFAAQLSIQPSAQDKICYSLFNKLPEEGFCAGTLVKIPSGYESIENLVVGDIIVDADGNQTEILAITRHYVDEYIKFYLKDAVVCMGCDQRFSLFSDAPWTVAHDVQFYNEHIIHPTVLYALTTQSHTLCVTLHDVLAHNSAAIFAGASSVCIGYVAVINPVVVLLGGATIALAVVAYNAHQEYVQKYADKDDSFFVAMPDSVILADRFYYELRKNDLEKIKQELLGIKNDVEKIRALYSASFMHQFLQHHTYNMVKNVQLLSVAQEKCLCDEQKSALRKTRDAELALFETQIEEIQFLLALHVNQLIDNVQYAQSLYDDAISDIQEAIAAWNNNFNVMTNEIALRLYKYDLLQEHLIHGVHQAIDELVLVAEYYRICKSRSIQDSTTIVKTLNYISPAINEKKQWILQKEQFVQNNITIAERFFAGRNVSVVMFKNEAKKEFEKQKKERTNQVLQKIEMVFANAGFGGGPKKDDEEDDKDHSFKVEIYEKNAPHIFRNEPGHFSFDTPANRQLLIDMASDSRNFLGKCKYGNKWYGKILDNGQQIWVSVRNGFIRNGGLNTFPHSFNFETGLCRLIK